MALSVGKTGIELSGRPKVWTGSKDWRENFHVVYLRDAMATVNTD